MEHPAASIPARIALLFAAVWAMSCSSAPAAGHTNIVVILADDLGYGSVSWYGSSIPTPQIDSIAVNGVGFASGYVSAPVCNPSRPGLLTGRYQQRWGKELNSQTEPPVGAPPKSLPRSESALAEPLSEAGYATAAIGKWQLGMSDGHHPLDRGFEYFFGMPSGSRFVDASWPDARIAPGHRDPGEPDGSGRQRRLFRGREPVPMDALLTDMLAAEGAAFIDRHHDEPFFLYLAFHAPHTPIQTTEKYYQRFPEITDETERIYAAMISALDDGVGSVLEALHRHELESNTLVFFVSDNGAAKTSDLDGRRNAPLTGHKRNLYEGGIRVPFALQWPARLDGGLRYGPAVSSLDIVPTALAAAGVDSGGLQPLDGVDLMPFLEGEREGVPHETLFWRSGPNAAVRSGPLKLLLPGGGPLRLYNVEEDPAETKDLSADLQDEVRRLREAFHAWQKPLPPRREGSRKIKTKHTGDVIEWHI